MKSSKVKEFFQERVPLYQKDPVLFAKEICGFAPDPWQEEAMMAIASNPKVSVRSGHGVGKTAMEGVIVPWFLTCFKFSRVVATAPTRQQIHDILWSEIEKWRQNSPLLQQLLTWTKTYVYMNGYNKRWFAVARTSSRPEAVAGFHADNLLFVVDEASGIEDEIMETILATLSGGNNKLLMCGNPTKTTGTFFDSHNRDAGMYYRIKVSSMDSTRTNKDNIASLIRKYGADSNVVKVRVYGEFPTQEDDVFIPYSLIEASIANDLEDEKVSKISFGVDVARYGDDETVIAANIGGKIKIPVVRHGQNLMATVGDIVVLYRKVIEEYPQYKGIISVAIDDTGLGGGVTDRLREVKTELGLRRMEIIPVTFGSNPPQDGSEDYYEDITAYMWARIKDLMENKEIQMCDDDELVGQLSGRKYFITSKGRILLESKKDMKKRGIKSPDRADAVALACYEQNKVYDGFVEKQENIVITADAIRQMSMTQISIGISIGGSLRGTSIVATGITANHSRAIVLKADKYLGETDTNAISNMFLEFARQIKSMYGRLDYIYCDPKEKFLYRTLRDVCQASAIDSTVRAAIGDNINDRIRLTNSLISQGRLFVSEECEPLTRALSEAVWNEKKTADTRSENSDSGTLNAFEYTIEREAARFLNG